jgi:hypothetical protein
LKNKNKVYINTKSYISNWNKLALYFRISHQFLLMFTFKNWKKFYNLLCETIYQAFLHVFFSFCLLHSWQTVVFWDQWDDTHTPCARDHCWTLDFANAFLSPGVNSRAELVPSPGLTPGTALRAVGSGISKTPARCIALYICALVASFNV